MLKFFWQLTLAVVTLGLLGLLLPPLITMLYAMTRIYQATESPSKRLAIVFGAESKVFSLSDCLMSGFAVFSLKYPSLLQFDQGGEDFGSG